jgi:hypothetical protein
MFLGPLGNAAPPVDTTKCFLVGVVCIEKFAVYPATLSSLIALQK